MAGDDKILKQKSVLDVHYFAAREANTGTNVELARRG